MIRTFTLLTAAGIALLGGVVVYAAYFDYKRRNDVEFRKRLRKDKKRVDKTLAQLKESTDSNAISTEELRAALETVRNEEMPKTVEAKEHYFMAQVSLGEQLALQGPAFFLPAALSFYRALRVYPSPVELIVIYQKTLPEPVFKIVMEMTNLDVKDRIEGYYEHFPPKSMNVTVQTKVITESGSNQIRKKILVACKDFAQGQTIYTENPVVAVLDRDLQWRGTHCSHCLRHIQPGLAIKSESERLNFVYCSKDCQVKAKNQSQNLLFSLESPLPSGMAASPLTPQNIEDRKAAQTAFIDYLERNTNAAPFLVAKFIARQVAIETVKMLPTPSSPTSTDYPEPDSGEYTLYDHMERLRYLEVTATEEETKTLRGVLQNALPGLEQFVTEDRHATLLGKMNYNAYGVCFGGGRDDKPPSTENPENVEKTRTPYGTSRQIGCGFYFVSSYISHSCAPSARPSFSNGTSELHLIAMRPIKKGDEITVAYVDVTQHPTESAADARRRRRMELAHGWRFACQCTKCVAESDSSSNSDVAPPKDESKVDETVTRIENQIAA